MIHKRILRELQKKQNELQKWFKENVKAPPKGKYDMRGVWISISCGCGHSYSTPYNTSGTCRVCKKRVTTFQDIPKRKT